MSVLASPRTTAPTVSGLDPRGLRFAAAVTVAVLAVVLVTLPSPIAVLLLGWQALVFGLGAFAGPGRQPYGWVFRRALRPRLGRPAALEAPEPPRFAQAVGLVFAVAALLGLAIGATLVAYLAIALALSAALLNAAFGFCLGCEMYLLAVRLRRA